MKIRFALLVLALGAAAPLCAQDLASIAPGSRVRITWRNDANRLDGRFVALHGDTIVIRDSASAREAAVALSWLRSVEVYAGKGQGRTMTLLGVVAGAAAGALAGHFLSAPKEPKQCPGPQWCLDFGIRLSHGEAVGVGVALGAALFGVVGHDIDSRDRWVRLPIDRVRVGVAPLARGRLGLGATISF